MKPVCLPTSNTCLPTGSTCVVTGWGNTDRLGGQRFPDRLQEAAVKILDPDFCSNPDPNNKAEPIKNKYYNKLYNDNMVCAGSASAFTDACQGDSGGPLSCKMGKKGPWISYGIVSWGVGCGVYKRPGVYARVTNYMDWVEKLTGVKSNLDPLDYGKGFKLIKFFSLAELAINLA